MVVGEAVPREKRFTRLERKGTRSFKSQDDVDSRSFPKLILYLAPWHTRKHACAKKETKKVGCVPVAERGSILFKRAVEPNIVIPTIETPH